MKRTRAGTRAATPEVLPELVEAAHVENPVVDQQEDWQPYDARLEVLVRWGRDLYRLLPGSLERPVATVDQLQLLTRAIDPVLVPRLGYGLFDVVELVLRRVDHVASVLAPTWPDDFVANIETPPSVTPNELATASQLMTLAAQTADCSNPERARLALENHSVQARKLSCDVTDPVSSFGPILAVKAPSAEFLPLPAGILVESLDALGVELARKAFELDPSVEDRWAALAANRVGHMLQGSGHQIAGPIEVADGHLLHSLIEYSPRQVLAVDVVAALQHARVQERLLSGSENLGKVVAGATVTTPGGRIAVSPDAEVARFQVIAAPTSGQALRVGDDPVGTLKDLLWFTRHTARQSSDLWHFVRDLADPKGVSDTFAWDLIDAWEVWRNNGKSFYRGGVPVSMMMFAPHAAEAEWRAAAEAAEIERALLKLDLPPLRAWPLYDGDSNGETVVGDLDLNVVYELLPWSTPVAIRTTDEGAPAEHSDTLWGLADGITWKLAHAQDAFEKAAAGTGMRSLRIEFKFQSRTQGPVLSADSVSGDLVLLGWDLRLEQALLDDSRGIEALAGRLIAKALDAGTRAKFIEGWNAAPPGVRVDAVTVHQRAPRLPDPIAVHQSLRSDAQRRLGAHLLHTGTQSGGYDGDKAKRLESHTVYPWLIGELHRLVDECDAVTVLEMALTQLERANSRRWWYDQRLAWQLGFPVHAEYDDDPPEERREGITNAIKCISLIVEEALARPPPGASPCDELVWTETLSVAELALESSLRSESIHLNLTRTAVTVTDSFEVKIDWSADPTDVDLRAYSEARANETLPTPIAIGEPEPGGPAQESEDSRGFVDLMPELAHIDEALRGEMGFGLNALIGVLNVARQWEVSPEKPVATASPGDVIEQTVDLGVGATPEEYAQALEWLTLRAEDLRDETLEHWETERRAIRVATRPFVSFGDILYVLPWSAEMTLKILANYLSDGRLPWPDRVLPTEVTQALDDYRQRRNRDLERDCLEALSSENLIVRGGIKPEKVAHYGIDSLSGEIDVVCIDQGRSRIWVIEAKDPYTPFSPRQIRRHLTDFHTAGRYVDKLLQKTDEIRQNARSMAKTLRVEKPEREWTVVGLMVTRHPEPAAYAINARVPFCTIDQLREVVDRDAMPVGGAV